VAVGPVTKTILAMHEVSERAIRFFTLSRLDTLALGGILAYAVDREGLDRIAKGRAVGRLLRFGLPVFCVVVGLRAFGIGSTNWTIVELSTETLLCGWVVIRTAQGFEGATGRLLGSAPMVYLGQISYGLYLLHKPIPTLLRSCGIDTHAIPAGIGFLLYSALAVLVASASWYLFEGPVNTLKRKFPYRINGAVPGPQPAFAVGTRE
jgi:peptidoglycan/LPS O-acetylase OafA/YrhL